MNITFQLKPLSRLINIGLFLLFIIGANAFVRAQCPADPASCVPNTSVSQLPTTAFICEGVTSVLLNPQITGGNFLWFRETTPGVYDAAGSASSLASINVVGNYYLCHQQSNSGCYMQDKVVVATKVLADQLTAEMEFDRPASLFICSGQAKPFFNTPGNTAKYTYSWTPSSLFTGPSNIKNARYTTTYPKGALSVGSYKPTLTIKETSSNCFSSKLFNPIVYPPPNPNIHTSKTDPFCQNKAEELSFRVFVVNSYAIKSGTIQVGADPIINLTKADFVKIPSNQSEMQPNTLGEVAPSATVGKNLNNPSISVDVAKKPISSTAAGTIPVTFTMVTDSGCTASVSTNFTVNSSTPFTVETGTANKTSFCITDPKEGPLKSTPTGTGTFSGPGVKLEPDGNYYFHPSVAGAGQHTITFTVSGTGCAGGGSTNVTVRPAPKPKLVGREVVCLGVPGIEYRDTCKFLNSNPNKDWEIKTTSGGFASGISFVRYPDAQGDSIRVDFPTAYSEVDMKALIIAINDDAGCKASDTIIVTLNPLLKSPQPIGDTVFCKPLLPATTLTVPYKSGSPSSAGFTHQWNVVGGSVVPAGSNAYQVNVEWDINASAHRIWIRDQSTSLNSCYIDSRDLTIDFIAPPAIPVIANTPLVECAGTPKTLSIVNSQPGVTYNWTKFNRTGSSIDIVFPPFSEGPVFQFDLIAKLSNCPEVITGGELNIKPTPADPLPEDVIEHCFDDEPLLNITVVINDVSPPPAQGPSALWTNPLDLNNTDDNDLTWKASSSGIYTVKLTDGETPCSNTGSVEVIEICNAKFFLPRAFSPNGDRDNDSLVIFGNHFTSFDLKIYNRWGEVIFSTTNPKNLWDGNYAGMPMPQGTYPYSVKYESINANKKKVTKKEEGSVSLIR